MVEAIVALPAIIGAVVTGRGIAALGALGQGCKVILMYG